MSAPAPSPLSTGRARPGQGAIQRSLEVLLAAGVPVYCGAYMRAALAMEDGEEWRVMDRAMSQAARLGLIVLKDATWMAGDRLTARIQAFKAARRPVVWMNVGKLPPEFEPNPDGQGVPK